MSFYQLNENWWLEEKRNTQMSAVSGKKTLIPHAWPASGHSDSVSWRSDKVNAISCPPYSWQTDHWQYLQRKAGQKRIKGRLKQSNHNSINDWWTLQCTKCKICSLTKKAFPQLWGKQMQNLSPPHLAYYFVTDPANIMCKQCPEPRLLNTGLAKSLQRACRSALIIWDHSTCSLCTEQSATFSRLHSNGRR